MRPDGTQRRFLTPPCREAISHPAAMPAWDPSGLRLLFAANRFPFSDSGLRIADADGSHATPVPLSPPPPDGSPGFFWRLSPSFAPDGRHFVYEREDSGLRTEVWLATIDGSEDRFLQAGSSPRWSPRGGLIAFAAPVRQSRNGPAPDGGTWLMRARTGVVVRRIWRRTAGSLDWSPNGRRLVASDNSQQGYLPRPADLFILRADGGGATRVGPATRVVERDPAWSPDGHRIAFVRERTGYSQDLDSDTEEAEIWTMSVHGTDAKRIWKRDWQYEPSPPMGLAWQSRPLPPRAAPGRS